MTELPGHGVAAMETAGDTFVSRCSCGWSAPPARSEGHARARLEYHLSERLRHARAVSADAAARELVAASHALRAGFARALVRRDELRSGQQRVRDALDDAYSSAGTSRVPAWRVLESAREHADLTYEELWFDYISLGGCRSPEWLVGVLHGDGQLDRSDVVVLTCALNERFTDLGLGRPLPLRLLH